MPQEQNILTLTPVEHTTITKHLSLPKGLDARLRFAVHNETGVEIRLSKDDLEALVHTMLEVLSDTEDMALADVLTGVLSRLHPEMAREVPDEFDRSIFPPELPDEMCQDIHNMLREGQFETLDEAYEAVQGLLEQYNDEAQDELLGLTPAQGYALLSSGWNERDSVTQIRTIMGPEELSGSSYYHRAVTVLQMLEDAGGAKLTPKKNLTRKWVRQIMEAIGVPENSFGRTSEDYASSNEDQCSPVHYVRIFLELAGMVRVAKGKLVVTKRGRQCLEPTGAGELQAAMFLAMVTEFNLAYFDGAPEYDGVQSTYPFILYALGKVAREPIAEADVADAVFLPDVAEEFLSTEHFSHDTFVLYTRVLRPLSDFGLIALTSQDEGEESNLIHVTPLFDQMVQFRWPEKTAKR